MKNQELIKEFTDKIIMKEDDNGSLLKQIIVNKTKELVAKMKFVKLREDIFDGAIKFNGDDVMVNGKRVGFLKYDLDAQNDSGLNFVSEDKTFSKEFDSLEDLYSFLMKRFNVKENRMEDLGHTPETPKKVDFEGKENLAKQPGTEGADPDGKKGGDLKGKTKGEFKPLDAPAQGATSKYPKIKSLIADIKAGKRKTSTDATGEDTASTTEKGEPDWSEGKKGPDSVDVVDGHDASGAKPIFKENKENWKLDNTDADGEGKVGRLKAGVKAIKKIADKNNPKE